MRVEGYQVDISDLWIFHITDHLTGKILILKSIISKLNNLPRNVSLEIAI